MSLQSQLDALMKKLTAPSSIGQVFPDPFIAKHTQCRTAKEWFSDAGVTDQITYDRWSSSKPDSFVRQNSNFQSWADMLKEGALPVVKARQNKRTLPTSISGDKSFDSIQIDLSIITVA